MKAYSIDLRQKIIDVHTAEDISQRQLSDRFNVSLSTIQRYLKLVRRGEGLEAKAHGGGKPAKLTSEQLEKVEALIAANSDATLVELCELVSTQEKVQVSRSTMGRLTQSLGFSRKKNAARK
ncbi:MAG: transposase [Phormidesmis sp.]